MQGFATVQLAGNLTRDPELRQTNDGVSVCNFGIAVNRKRGENETVSFFDVDCWRGLADTVANFKTKGDPVAVTGRLEQRTYENRDGVTVNKVSITADEVLFLPGGSGNEGAPPKSQNASRGKSQGGSGGTRRAARQQTEEEYDEIPF